MPSISIFGARGHMGRRYTRAAQAMGWDVVPFEDTPDFAVCCWPATRRREALDQCIASGIPLLTEKPTAMTMVQGQQLYSDAKLVGLPFATAFVHLHNPLIQHMRGSKNLVVRWCGPHVKYTSGYIKFSVPAWLEWGPHAWSLAWYLADNVAGARVDGGYAPERDTHVTSELGSYSGEYETGDNEPSRCLLRDFLAWSQGTEDERFSPDLGLFVHSRCT